MEIMEITENKDQYMEYLLIGDEQESMVMKYLERGTMFALYEDFDLKTVAVVTKENNDTYELKNLATLEIYQRKGYGSAMVKHIIQYCNKKCKNLIVGTGDNENILIFYEKFGFSYSHTVKDFYINNYDHAIIENGKQLKDMIYMKIDCGK
ncbi:MAG: GNAT family N-acetyltransferase [Treponema sp.]|jgi:ribosomal protein S18 acetylase RimI-like enzyme|nr:GNAT family N-acetyltransferase [Treponema sp.]